MLTSVSGIPQSLRLVLTVLPLLGGGLNAFGQPRTLEAWIEPTPRDRSRASAEELFHVADATAVDKLRTVKAPKTPFELLENIKFAIEAQLLLQPDFLDEERLKQFTGATSVRCAARRADQHPGAFYCEFEGFEKIVEPRRTEKFVMEGIALSLSQIRASNGAVASALLLLEFHQERVGLPFARVTHLFGPGWKDDNRPISPHRRLAPSTAPNGNARITYGKGKSRLDLVFGPNAELSSISFRAAREHN